MECLPQIPQRSRPLSRNGSSPALATASSGARSSRDSYTLSNSSLWNDGFPGALGPTDDFRSFLEEGTFPERKALIRNFVKGVEVAGDEATLSYTIPMPAGGRDQRAHAGS